MARRADPGACEEALWSRTGEAAPEKAMDKREQQQQQQQKRGIARRAKSMAGAEVRRLADWQAVVGVREDGKGCEGFGDGRGYRAARG